MTKDVTLLEMIDAMKHYKDDETFRWFQDSYIGAQGTTCAGQMYRVTMGQVRSEIAELKMLRQATTRIMHVDESNCTHNIEIDPVTGQCQTCGEYLP